MVVEVQSCLQGFQSCFQQKLSVEAAVVQWQVELTQCLVDWLQYLAGLAHLHLEEGHLEEGDWWAKVEVQLIVYTGQVPEEHPIAPELCSLG